MAKILRPSRIGGFLLLTADVLHGDEVVVEGFADVVYLEVNVFGARGGFLLCFQRF